jgi:hypothetical protein
MPLTALGALGISAGAKAILGIGQLIGAGKAPKEPKYIRPQQSIEAEQLGREIGTQGMPRKAYESALQNIQQSAVLAVRNIASLGRGSALAGQGNVQAQQDKSVLGLATQDAIEMQKNQRFMYSALMAGAQAEDKKFANEFQSYVNKLQRQRASIGAFQQNLAGATDTLMGGMMQLNYIDAMTGGGTTTNPLLRQTSYNPQQKFLSGNVKPISFTPRIPGIG